MDKGKQNPGVDEFYVEEFTVAEVPLDSDTSHHNEIEHFHETAKGGEQEDGVNMQYQIEDHQYISQSEGYQKLKEVKENNTKYIICSPGESLENYKASWTRGMTQILIEEYRNMIGDFRNPHKKQKDLWYELANNMCERGCDVTWDMCDRKWRNLKHTFKTIYYNHHRSAKSKRRWEFYNDLQELFSSQSSDEGLRKSRTISPPRLDDQDSQSADASSLGQTSKFPKLLPNPSLPQVSYAQLLDAASLQNPIITYPQIILCDENGVPLNKKPNIASTSSGSNNKTLTSSGSNNKTLSDDAEGSAQILPNWFKEFMKQYQKNEDRRLHALKEMHAEVIQVEKRKCVALENLLKKLT